MCALSTPHFGDCTCMSVPQSVDVRFIEYMPFDGNKWNFSKFVSYAEMKTMILEKYPDLLKLEDHQNDTSKVSFVHLSKDWHTYICLSIDSLYVCLSVDFLYVCLSVDSLYVCLSVDSLYVCLSVDSLYVCLFCQLSVCSSVCFVNSLYVCLSLRPLSVCLYVCPSTLCMFVCLSVASLYVCQSVR